MEEYIESELSGIFRVKSNHQKYSAWVPEEPIYAYKG